MFIITVSLIHFFPLIPYPFYRGSSFYLISGVDNGNIGSPLSILISLPLIYWIAGIEPNTMNFSLLFILLFVVLFLRFPLISLLSSFVVYECFITPLSFIPFPFLPSSHRIRTAFISSLFTTSGSISFILSLLILILSNRRISPLMILIPLCIKIPPSPSSYRSPEVHREANSPIPSLPAGLLSKLGIFGILRSILPPSPLPLRFLSSFVPSLPLTGIILAPRSSYRYFDSKKMIASSSILHSNPSFASIVLRLTQ